MWFYVQLAQKILNCIYVEVLPYNHCLYDNLNRFHFIVPLDIDEIIFPIMVVHMLRIFNLQGAFFQWFNLVPILINRGGN